MIIKNGGVTTATGFQAAAVNADVKGKGRTNLDLALLVSDAPCSVAGLFTCNLVKAAPVLYDVALLEKKGNFRGIIVNSGNANACTGEAGLIATRECCREAEKVLLLPAASLLAASTGVIGTQFPTERVVKAIAPLAETLSDDGGTDFAKAIMTTDTLAKEYALLVETKEGNFVVGGTVKGAGMIAPELATMLAFITTDADCAPDVLSKVLKKAVACSFNRITVDGDMSTNDTVLLFANGMSGVKITGPNEEKFTEALSCVCLELAKMMVRDGEGATKFITITAEGANTHEDAAKIAAKISNSSLVKTMFAGEDPNWGRLMASAGAAGADFDPEAVSIYLDALHYVENGKLIDAELEKEAAKIMKQSEYTVRLSVGKGPGKATYYTCDLTKEYVAINADYRS